MPNPVPTEAQTPAPSVALPPADSPPHTVPQGGPQREDNERHIVRNAALVSALFLVASLMGLVRNVLIARIFGIGMELDAFYAAFKLPDLLFTIVAGGALATAFIPVFTQLLTEENADAAWRMASSITNLVVLVVSLCAVFASVGAPWLVRTLIAPGFAPAQQVETVLLMRVVLLSTLFFGISAVQSSALHSFKHFLLPALAPVVYPLGVVLGAIFLVPLWGTMGLALGALAGSVLHLLVKVPALLRYRFRWWPVLEWRDPSVRSVLLLMGPRVLDLGIFHLTLLATTNLASRLGPGSVSALEWGWDFMQLPETVIGTAFGLVAFPTLADLAARRDLDGLRTTLVDTLGVVLSLAAPAAVGLILLGRPLVQFVYERGAFDAAATQAVYIALSFYTLGLVGHVALELIARAFFALQDTVTPLIVAAVTAIFYVATGLFLMRTMGHGGLALANALAITAEVLLLLWLLRGRLHGVDGRRLLGMVGRIAAACAIMAVGVWFAAGMLGNDGSLLMLLSAGATGALLFLAAGWLLRVPLIRSLPGYIRSRSS